MHHEAIDITQEKRHIGDSANRLIQLSAMVGVGGLVVGGLLTTVLSQGTSRFFHALLVSFCFYLSLSLGALFFVMIQHLTRAGWSVVLRRMAEGIAGGVRILIPIAVLLMFGMNQLYWRWITPEPETATLIAGKSGYLDKTFFVIRMGVYLAAWFFMASSFWRMSTRQDETGDPKLTLTSEGRSAWCMVVYAMTVTFFSFDALMSLYPAWYSTIFGVYYFSGGFVGFAAVLAVMVFFVQRYGFLQKAITPEHYQDIGKLIFAFLVFWAYIAFSQYMLIWYGNIPEETDWFLYRWFTDAWTQTDVSVNAQQLTRGPWAYVSLLLLFGHFILPFLAVINRNPKRRLNVLAIMAAWVLFMHWLDLYWIVMPTSKLAEGGVLTFSLMDIACMVGVGGLWVADIAYRMKGHAVVPERDPRLRESLTFENV